MVVLAGLGVEEMLVLYDRHARGLVGFFARRTGDAELALDVLGDTFVAAFAARASCRASDDAGRAAWLYRIAGNELADYFRREHSRMTSTTASSSSPSQASYVEPSARLWLG